MTLKTCRATGVLIAALSSAACASAGSAASDEARTAFEAFYPAIEAPHDTIRRGVSAPSRVQ